MTWEDRLDEAEERRREGSAPFTAQDIMLAQSWDNCALGEMLEIVDECIEVDEYDVATGLAFADAIEDQDLSGAKRIYNKIWGRTRIQS